MNAETRNMSFTFTNCGKLYFAKQNFYGIVANALFTSELKSPGLYFKKEECKNDKTICELSIKTRSPAYFTRYFGSVVTTTIVQR
jgi:hypothetical protein